MLETSISNDGTVACGVSMVSTKVCKLHYKKKQSEKNLSNFLFLLLFKKRKLIFIF